MKTTLPRPEYPRPQFERSEWINLNGEWTYQFDFGASGMHAGRALHKSTGFSSKIIVPFCPESSISGVGHKDFIENLFYHKTISIPAAWSKKRIIINFGGVDYESELFIDGNSIGLHYGGSVSFQFDITNYVKAGSNHNLVLRVHDKLLSGSEGHPQQPSGKQSCQYKSFGCAYTRTTGIWQTVWLEAVDPNGLKSAQIIADYDYSRFSITPTFYGTKQGNHLKASLLDNGKIISKCEGGAQDGASLILDIPSPKEWSPSSPFLYDIILEVIEKDGTIVDTVKSYAGLRKIHIEGSQIYLNNKPLYLRMVLDQGFYPDGIWTAPSDEALKHDIELSMKAGFNGARLHQKVFEERFHYWADRLGYLTWGESASWGCDTNTILGARNFLSEWAEIIARDRNHPSIIAWTPFNETWQMPNPNEHYRVISDAYKTAKLLDPTRPVNDASGYIHEKTDLWTIHDYSRAKDLSRIDPPDGSVYYIAPFPKSVRSPYMGQPYIIDEFGGLKWIPQNKTAYADNTWGYGDDLPTLEAFYEELKKQVDLILSIKRIGGYCYTQLTDVEQEQNGIYNYDRSEKFDMEVIHSIFSRNQPN